MTAEKLATRGLGFLDAEDISDHVSKWCSIFFQRSSPQSKSYNNSQSWEIRKNYDDLSWWIKDQKSFTLFFDGASKGNPGKEGVGGLILNPRGQIINSFSWGLGSKTNNEDEWLALLQGLEMIDAKIITRLIILWNSCQVILKMKTCYPSGSIKCRRLHSRILQLHLPEITYFYHILRETNAKPDTMANKGASLSQGSIILNGEETSFKHIP